MMMNCLLLYFVLEVLFGDTVSGISEIHYKRVFIKDFEIPGYYDSISAPSVISCSIICSRLSQCRSYSYRNNIDDDNITCYLYSKVAILTSSSIPKTGLVYYWKLADSCPASYQKNNELSLCLRTFLSPSDEKTLPDAEKRCEQDGGHLIIIDTEGRRKFLAEFLTASGDNVWSLVGGIKLGTRTEDWHWYNGANVTNWYTNQPDNHQGIEDCLQAAFIKNTTTFNDAPCGVPRKYHFICEIPVV